MKKLPLIILLFAAAACASKNGNTAATNTAPPDAVTHTAPVDSATNIIYTDSLIVSGDGISDLKIGMNLQSVEKLLKRPLSNVPPPKEQGNGYGDARDTVRGIYPDTLDISYRGVDYTLTFTQGWQKDSTYATTVDQVLSRSPLLKTSLGIRMGDELTRILNVYGRDKVRSGPDADSEGEDALGVPGQSQVRAPDGDNGNNIVFYMFDHKVVAMRVIARTEGD
ncbi:MAG TPA: hypothetical protein VGM41_19460 [Chitinophagaceae bacterium]|jgi:hypothetical protein